MEETIKSKVIAFFEAMTQKIAVCLPINQFFSYAKIQNQGQ